MNFTSRVGLGLTVLVMAGCAARGPVPSEVTGRDTVRDGAPPVAISPDQVKDAVPRPDPILSLGNISPYTVLGKTYEIMPGLGDYRERGIASWYGTKFDGRKTSNGEVFHLYGATAAHKTLPIPCYVRVTNLDNNRSIVVRVNDRGPFHNDRLIDLSYGVATRLGFVDQGTAPVEVELINLEGIDDRRDNPLGVYRYLQLGAFDSEASALRLRKELTAVLSSPVAVSQVDTGNGLLYRVRIGPVDTSEQIMLVQRQLEAGGYSGAQLLP